jgi:hypothetical protein
MRALSLIFLTFSSSTAIAQMSFETSQTKFFNECFREAIAANEIKVEGKRTYYSCVGDKAKNWFDTLSGDKEVHDKNGLFVARYYGETGYCAHQTEDAAKKPVSAYVCEIVTVAP